MIRYDYPSIFLDEAVQKDLLITDGTVTVNGNNYTVTGDTITITNNELESEAFELHQSLNSDLQLRFGSCESASVSFVFHPIGNITTLKGKTVKVYVIPNHEASKILQIGVFKVAEDKLSDDRTKRQITAYDAMYDILNSDVASWYNGQLPHSESSKTVIELTTSFLAHFDVEAEPGAIIGLVNGSKVIRRTISPNMLSGGDVIKAICEINGVFGMITNEGKFRFKRLSSNIRDNLDDDRTDIFTFEYTDIHFEDYDSREIDGVRIITDNGDVLENMYPFTPAATNPYVINGNFLISDYNDAEISAVLYMLRNRIPNHFYTPCVVNCIGMPYHEVGDPIRIFTRQTGVYIYTYILERHLKGIQALRDTYTANGVEYISENLNSLENKFKQISQDMARSSESAIDQANLDFVEIMRNIGIRLLDEPDNVYAVFDIDNETVSIRWKDPLDITSHSPVPCAWEGTIVVRKENSPPLNRWDGEVITDSTVRNQYQSTPYVDTTFDYDKVYYYGIFPYYTEVPDPDYPIKYYRYTKSVKVETSVHYFLITEGSDYILTEDGKKIIVN